MEPASWVQRTIVLINHAGEKIDLRIQGQDTVQDVLSAALRTALRRPVLQFQDDAFCLVFQCHAMDPKKKMNEFALAERAIVRLNTTQVCICLLPQYKLAASLGVFSVFFCSTIGLLCSVFGQNVAVFAATQSFKAKDDMVVSQLPSTPPSHHIALVMSSIWFVLLALFCFVVLFSVNPERPAIPRRI